MQPKELGDLLGVTSNTVRRWCVEFHKYLTPTAHPPKGKPRVLAPHDVKVLHYVAASRDAGQPIETVIARLDAMQADEWKGLPDTPPEWDQRTETITLPAAASRAYDVAQIAVLQRDLEYTRGELQNALQRADSAEQKLNDLVAEIDAVRASGHATQQELAEKLHGAELELQRARGDVSALQARLAAYALTGDRPLPLAVIILVTALAAVVIVLVVFAAARLLVG